MTRRRRNRQSSSNGGPAERLDGFELVFAVCGGIAAYKSAAAVSGLVQRGAGVTVVMTESATRFVGPLTFESLTARKVFTSLWDSEGYHDPQHLRLTEAADLFVVAPATANILAKFAYGMADDLVSTMVLSADCPVLLAPSMNTRMWNNPVVQRNLGALRELGMEVVEPGTGWLACRTVGAGRMAEAEDIIASIAARLTMRPRKGRRP